MKKQITIGEYEGKFFLIGADGYSTSSHKWKTRTAAEKARAREQKIDENLIKSGKTSRMNWIY
jgi:hypothetical protein